MNFVFKMTLYMSLQITKISWKYLSRLIDIVIFDIIGKASSGVRATPEKRMWHMLQTSDSSWEM